MWVDNGGVGYKRKAPYISSSEGEAGAFRTAGCEGDIKVGGEGEEGLLVGDAVSRKVGRRKGLVHVVPGKR